MTAKEFWDWFQENEAFIRKELPEKDPDNSPTIEEFANLLEEYAPDLGHILAANKKPNKKHKLTISTNGDKKYIVAVRHLVSQAPEMEHWKVQAFIPPMKKISKKFLNAIFDVDGHCIKIKHIKVAVTGYFDDEKMFELTFVLPFSFAQIDQEHLRTRLWFLLEDVFGEFMAIEKILQFKVSYQMEDPYEYETIKTIREFMEGFDSSLA